MPPRPRHACLALVLLALGACNAVPPVPETKPEASRALYPNETQELRALINQYADQYSVPPELVQRVVIRESTHVPTARNGPYYGLMQILPSTARQMGYQGSPSGLLDAETNLKYAVKYLRGAWMLAGGSQDRAVGLYAKGYYNEAKQQGLLEETGLR